MFANTRSSWPAACERGPVYGPVRQLGSADTLGREGRARPRGASGSARGAGRRDGLAGEAAIRASTLGQVPSAHQRLYQRQHVDVAA